MPLLRECNGWGLMMAVPSSCISTLDLNPLTAELKLNRDVRA